MKVALQWIRLEILCGLLLRAGCSLLSLARFSIDVRSGTAQTDGHSAFVMLAPPLEGTAASLAERTLLSLARWWNPARKRGDGASFVDVGSHNGRASERLAFLPETEASTHPTGSLLQYLSHYSNAPLSLHNNES